MAGKKTIDAELFAKLVARGVGEADAYRKCGYKPKGSNDNASKLANQFKKRKEVSELIEFYRDQSYGDLKDITKERLRELLTDHWAGMTLDQKIAFTAKACKTTGVEAPKHIMLEAQNTIKVTHEISPENALNALEQDPRFAQLFARPIEAEIIERPEPEETGSSTVSSDTDE